VQTRKKFYKFLRKYERGIQNGEYVENRESPRYFVAENHRKCTIFLPLNAFHVSSMDSLEPRLWDLCSEEQDGAILNLNEFGPHFWGVVTPRYNFTLLSRIRRFSTVPS